MTPSIPPHPGRFVEEIADLLQPQHPPARALSAFIRRSLRQFHLEGRYTEEEIFNEACRRGLESIQNEQTIQNPAAWMRSTAYNVIREYSRRERRYQPMEVDYLETLLVAEAVIEVDLEAVQVAFQRLSEGDRLIIQLWIIEQLSWREIALHLQTLGEPELTEQTLRKRGQRARQKLRENYHQIRPA